MRLFPFRALRPVPGRAADIVSVPYDVVNTEEARALAEGRPLSFLRVVRSEIELAPDQDPYAEAVYTRARDNLDRYLTDGHMIADPESAFYIYRLNMGARQQTGLVSTAAIDDYFAGLIKKHELTRADKQRDRTRHIEVTGANTGPVFLTYRDAEEPGLALWMDRHADQATPLYDVTADDGVRHRVYRLAGADEIETLRSLAANLRALYIADGHHRAASGCEAGRRLREIKGPGTGNEPYNRLMVVSFPDRQLHILPYNRAVKSLNGNSPEIFLEKIKAKFEISEGAGVGPRRMRMFLGGRWFGLVAREATFAGAGLIESLDVSILQSHLLGPVLGIEDPRTSDRISFIGGIRGEAELERLVDSGAYAVAFSLAPVSLAELIQVADAGEIMPPKSTWFEPKLRSGFVVHRITE